MDDIKATIKAYALVIDDTLDKKILDFMVEEIVDRFLAYTNRFQLVDGYTRFLADEFYSDNCTKNRDGEYEPILPIPSQIERVLARAITKAYDTTESTEEREISSLSDNGQSVTFGKLKTFFEKEDAVVFSGYISIINNFRIPTVVDNPEYVQI